MRITPARSVAAWMFVSPGSPALLEHNAGLRFLLWDRGFLLARIDGLRTPAHNLR
jgi:hypothetical protein